MQLTLVGCNYIDSKIISILFELLTFFIVKFKLLVCLIVLIKCFFLNTTILNIYY